MKKMPVILSLAAVISACAIFAGNAGAQQTYPSRPIRIISPYAAGGSSSTQARLLARKLNEAWGQPVIVDDRPGAIRLSVRMRWRKPRRTATRCYGNPASM